MRNLSGWLKSGTVPSDTYFGVPRPDPYAPRASDQLRAAYEAALRDKTSSDAAER